MGKVVGLVGAASGKIGNIVYAVTNGIQTARVYQPIITNPKSNGQRLQRAKANLVGQISKITPWQILVGLGVSRRSRRSRFLRLCLNGATSQFDQTDPSIVLAKLDAPDFKFSEGAVLPTITASSVSAYNSAVSVVLSRIVGSTDEEFLASGALVVVTVLTADGKYESVLYRFVDASEFSSSQNLTLNFNHIQEGEYFAEVYIAPFKTADGSSLRAKSKQLFGENTDFSARMSYEPSALSLEWGNSQAILEGHYTPSN